MIPLSVFYGYVHERALTGLSEEQEGTNDAPLRIHESTGFAYSIFISVYFLPEMPYYSTSIVTLFVWHSS